MSRKLAAFAHSRIPAILALVVVMAGVGTLVVRQLMAPPRPGASIQPVISAKGRFGPVHEYPAGEGVTDVVVLISDRSGWSPEADGLARGLAATGHYVMGIDLASYQRALEASTDSCFYTPGEISRDLIYPLEKRLPFPEFRAPVVVGLGAGATVAYATTVQAPPTSMALGVGLDFCPLYTSPKPFCGYPAAEAQGNGTVYYPPVPKLETPWQASAAAPCAVSDKLADFMTPMPAGHWIVPQGETDPDPAQTLKAALATLPPRVPAGGSAVADLPLVDIAPEPAPASPEPQSEAAAAAAAPAPDPFADTFAIIFSGDGGWRDLDRSIGQELARAGLPVVGLDSLRYFWRERTPQEVGADLSRIMAHYTQGLGRHKVVLVGYSFGAGVLPAAMNGLPPEQRAQVSELALLGFAPHADFEIKAVGFLGTESSRALPTLPEIARLTQSVPALSILCVKGDDETGSACDAPELKNAKILDMAGGHHFDGDYTDIAKAILKDATGKI